MKRYFFLFLNVIFLFISCEKDDIIDNIVDDQLAEVTDSMAITDYTSINEWLYEVMNTYYFWESELPYLSTINNDYPKDFFKSMVYEDEDSWSYITDNYESLSADLSGTPYSMGYSPAFYLYNNGENVLIVVEYVYPNSPASKAGLKRGDMILRIDGELLDQENYYELFSGDAYEVALGEVGSSDGELGLSGETISLVAEVVEADPAIYHKILDIDGMKIGYLVYTEFVSGDDDEYLATLDLIIDEFMGAGITNLVLDLRYNPGGSLGTAGYLASAIAPQNVVSNSEVLVRMDYNEMLDTYFEQREGKNSDNLVYLFPANSHNLNLNTVYFLVTSGTASACELLITGLQPYMNTVVIGENTYGKYTGSYVIPDLNDPPRHDWAVMPVVLKYQNAAGYTDFRDGLTPDYKIEDNLAYAVPFGDVSDPMLGKALELITGQVAIASVKSTHPALILQKIDDLRKKQKRNLFIDRSEL